MYVRSVILVSVQQNFVFMVSCFFFSVSRYLKTVALYKNIMEPLISVKILLFPTAICLMACDLWKGPPNKIKNKPSEKFNEYFHFRGDKHIFAIFCKSN